MLNRSEGACGVRVLQLGNEVYRPQRQRDHQLQTGRGIRWIGGWSGCRVGGADPIRCPELLCDNGQQGAASEGQDQAVQDLQDRGRRHCPRVGVQKPARRLEGGRQEGREVRAGIRRRTGHREGRGTARPDRHGIIGIDSEITWHPISINAGRQTVKSRPTPAKEHRADMLSRLKCER